MPQQFPGGRVPKSCSVVFAAGFPATGEDLGLILGERGGAAAAGLTEGHDVHAGLDIPDAGCIVGGGREKFLPATEEGRGGRQVFVPLLKADAGAGRQVPDSCRAIAAGTDERLVVGREGRARIASWCPAKTGAPKMRNSS